METQTTAGIGERAIAARLCDLGVVKTCRSCLWNWMVAMLVAGGAFSTQAQDDAADTNAAPTNATLTGEATTNADSTNTVATAEPAQTSAPESKPAAPSSGKLDYSSFKLVNDRNIFNGNRSGQRMTATRGATQQRSVRVESFSLVGTLLSEDKAPVAFFDGTGSELRKALKAGGNIAGFTVKEILHAGVRLGEGTNTIEMRVGTGLRREDEGLWKPSTTVASYASSSSSSPSASAGSFQARSGNNARSTGRTGRNASSEPAASSSPSGDSPPSADVNEVLKRLMEQREKE